MTHHSLHALARNLLKHGPANTEELLERWAPNPQVEVWRVLLDLITWGEIDYCEHCERLYLLDGGRTMGICGDCAMVLCMRVLGDLPEVIQ